MFRERGGFRMDSSMACVVAVYVIGHSAGVVVSVLHTDGARQCHH